MQKKENAPQQGENDMEYHLPFKSEGRIIELGGGNHPAYRPNADVRKFPNVDIVIDFNNPPYSQLKSGEYDIVYSSYLIEHISWRKVKEFINEAYRILKSDGKVRIITANLYEQCKMVANSKEWKENFSTMIFGDLDYPENSHKCGFSPDYIEKLFKDVGFQKVDIKDHPNCKTDMIIDAYKSEVKEVMITNSKEETNKNQNVSNIGTIHQFNRSYFDGEAYTGIGYQDFSIHYNTVDFIKKRNPKSVIDIGGARGYITKKLNDRGIPSVSMDISEHCYHTRATDRFVLHDLTKTPYPFEDKEFDLAVSVSSLEHIPEDKIESVIREMARISQRGLHGITFEITPQDVDKTHLSGTIKPKDWWVSKFKEIVPDYPVEIVDKEEMEAGPVIVPSSQDNLVKLNIGSFLNMYHYGWTNIDKLNLSEFAKQNGYIFRQEDISNHVPYENNSVDIIIASHFLEHLDRNEGKKFLLECSRVLKPKGVIRLTVPDTELITKKYIDKSISEYRHFNVGVEKSDDDTQSLYELLLSGHRTVYDYESLSKLLSRVGFDNIQRMEFGKSNSKEIEIQTIDMYPTLSLYIEANPSLIYSDIAENVVQDADKHDIVNKNWQIITAGKNEQTQDAQIYNSDKKLRIALISTPFFEVPPKGYSGLEMVLWDLAEGLDKLGHLVTIFANEGSNVPKHGSLVVTGPSLHSVNVNWFDEEKNRYQKWKDIISPERFDIVCGHDWFGFEYLHKMNNTKLRTAHVHHGGYQWETAPPSPKPNLIAISRFMRDYTIAYFKQKGFNIDCRFVHNGIDLGRYHFDPTIKRTNRLLYVGRFSRFKQPDMAIRVAKTAGLPIDLIGGSFIDDSSYMDQIESMCKGKDITIRKDVSHEYKIELMQKAKAIIVPSKMNEPLNLVSIEGQACGTPVIVTNDGGLPETVNHGVTGFVCDTENQIVEAISNIDTIKYVDCRKHIEDNFSRERMAKEYEKLFYDMMQDKNW